MSAERVYNVLFLCTGNSARSLTSKLQGIGAMDGTTGSSKGAA